MRCRLSVGTGCHPYLLAYHYAAHAVVMHRLRVPVVSVRYDRDRRAGAIHALLPHPDASGNRMAFERDAICALAGPEAEKIGCDSENWFRSLQDIGTVSKRLRRVTRDSGEQSAWHFYLAERARLAVDRAWHEILVVAAVLHRGNALNAASLGATLEAFRANPFRRDLQPLPPVIWKRPASTTPGGVVHEVELLWQKPTLSQLLARVRR